MGICSSIDITGHCWLFRATGGQHVVQWSWTKLSRLHLVLAGWHTVNSTDKTNTDKRKRPPMSQLTLDLTLNSSHYYQFNTNECHSSTGKFQCVTNETFNCNDTTGWSVWATGVLQWFKQVPLLSSYFCLGVDHCLHVTICKQGYSFYTVCSFSLPNHRWWVFCTGKHQTSLQMSRCKVKINHEGLHEKHLVHIPTYWATLRVNSLLHF